MEIDYIFDVDGTLTPSRGVMNSDFKNWFRRFIDIYPVSLVTGSDYDKTVEQVGSDITENVKYCFNCAGNAVYKNGILCYKNEWQCPDDLWLYLENKLYSTNYNKKYGKHFEQRIGLLNFSIVGREAKGVERTDYYNWDKINKERISISKEINERWPEIQSAVGGETGIDIFSKGCDKSQIIKYFNGSLCFFGDRLDIDGNDYTLAKTVIDQKRGSCYNVYDWMDTWTLLKKLCPNV